MYEKTKPLNSFIGYAPSLNVFFNLAADF